MNKDIIKFTELRPLYERFRIKIEELLFEIISGNELEIFSIESRTKTIESFTEKIERPGKNYKNPLSDITDLCGLRIITYYTEDIYRIAELIEKEFEIDYEHSIDKTKIESPDKFGYQSLHYVIKLNKNRNKLPEWKAYKNFKVEVQIRTILQHSWSAIDHKIRYKSQGEIPAELKRKIFRLSALLELADEEFLSIKNQTKQFSEKIEKSIDTGNLDLKFNFISLKSYFSNNDRVNKIVRLAEDLGYNGDYFEDEDSEYHFFNRFINLLSISKLKTIYDLDIFLNTDLSVFNENLKSFVIEFKKEVEDDFYAVPTDLIIILIVLNDLIKPEYKEILYKVIKWTDFSKTLERFEK